MESREASVRTRAAHALGLLAIVAGCGAEEPTVGELPGGEERPNVVFFLVDDLGWSDLGCYGSPVYRTPHVDALASRGTRFTNAYAAHPMCRSSRYSLLTGRYAARTRSSENNTGEVSPDEYTVAEAFDDAGYATFFAGKWHVGEGAFRPDTQGFDVCLGWNAKGSTASYFHPYGDSADRTSVTGLAEGGAEGEYLTDRLTEETVRFIEANRERPFFVYLSHYAVHHPLEAKADVVAKYEEIIAGTRFPDAPFGRLPNRKAFQKQNQDNATFAAMVESVDASLGRIVEVLDELGLSENTLVVFTSDNGGASCNTKPKRDNPTSNLPLQGGKYWLYEGGIRVPLVVAMPGDIERGATSDAVVVGTDHYPTMLDLARLELIEEQHLDGVSYAPVLAGAAGRERDAVFWHFPVDGRRRASTGNDPASAIREGRYKLIEWYETGSFELYDLSQDIGEERDIAQRQPELAQRLLARLREWREEVDAPMTSEYEDD